MVFNFRDSICLNIHPIARFIVLCSGTVVCSVFRDLRFAVITCLVLAVIAMRSPAFKFGLRTVILPFAAVALLIYGVAFPYALGEHATLSNLKIGVLYVARVTALLALWQSFFWTLPLSRIETFLRWMHIPSSLTQIILTSLILMVDIEQRVEAIMDARMAQGFCKRRTTLNYLLQVLPSLGALVSSCLITATERITIWEHEQLLGKWRIWNEREREPEEYLPVLSICVAGVSIGALLLLFFIEINRI